VEHAEEAGLRSADPLRIGGQVPDGGAGSVEEGGVAEALILPHEAPQFCGQGEGEEKVGSGQQALLLGLEPLQALVVLAGGAVAIAAALTGAVALTASGAGVEDGAELAGAAGGDGAQDLAVLTGDGLPVTREVGRSVAAPTSAREGMAGARLLHQIFEGGDGVLLALRGQMQIQRGGLERLVAEVLLDLAEVDAGLKQVGGVAVAQGVDGDPLREAELADHPT
jgi:hypothetical protein